MTALLISTLVWEGCEYEVVPGPVDCSENPVAIEVGSVQDANCALMDGRVEVVASGGSGPYRFILGENEPQESAVFEGLGAGVYEITALDVNNCSALTEVTVKNVDGMNISFETTAAGCGGASGNVTVSAFDGVEPYQFRLGSAGGYAATNSFSNLAPGEYELFVHDATGCEVSQKVKVKSGISFSASIQPIIEKSCAIDNCHNGTQFPDFRVFKNIHDNAAQIKKLTGDRTMPEDGTLTQTEIDMIACWVDDGALQN